MVQADPEVWAAWGHLARSVRTGETAFTALHGKDARADRAEHPERGAGFDVLITSLGSLVVDAVASSYDFSGRTHVVDVGGLSPGGAAGGGAARAARCSPGRCSTSHTSSRPRRGRTWRGLGSAVGGSFFEERPAADGCDPDQADPARLSDDECVTILRRCRESLRPDGVVLVVELLLDRPETSGSPP